MLFIGITPNGPGYKIAVLKKEANKISIDSLQELTARDVKSFYTQDISVTTGLEGTDLFIRTLQLPLTDRRKILAALPFQLESILPFSAEEAIVCPQLKQINKQLTVATLFTTAQETLQHHLLPFKNQEILIDAVSCWPAALVRFAHWQFPNAGKILAFHLYDNQILYTVSVGRDLVHSQTLKVEKIDELQLEKIAVYLKQKGAIDDQTSWLLTGDAADSQFFAHVYKGTQLKLAEENYRSYAISIGLAIDSLLQDPLTIQFCKKKFTPERTQSSRQKKILSYLAICLIGTIATMIGSSLVLKKKQQKILTQLQKELPATLAIAKNASQIEIEQLLFKWEKSIATQRSTFPFQPTTPKVSDVLAWLSAHPSFSSEEGGKKEGIEIKSLHYQLLKYPKIGDVHTPYLANLSLEFSAETPRLAREFHEDLLKGKGIANAKKEIRWHAQNHNYQASFELNREAAP